MPTFDTDVVNAVLAHMNGDHTDDNLLIARAFGSEDATAATMVNVDEVGGTWTYVVDGTTRELQIPWSTRISERPQIRREVVKVYEQACTKQGVTPRPH